MKKVVFILAGVFALAFGATNKEIEDYKMSIFKNSKQVNVKSVKAISRETMEGYGGWEAVTLLIEFTVDKNGKKQTLKASDMVFVKGELMSDDVVNLKKGKTFKDSFRPKPNNSYYDASHLIAGMPNAKNKILVFSDPLCPFCRDIVPDIIAAATKAPSKLAVYHYSFPLLTIHPASEQIVKAEISQRDKVKNKADFLTKIYATEVHPQETDGAKIAAKLSGELGVKIQKSDMDKKDVQTEYDEEMDRAYRLVIRGTPTIFINGEIDSSKTKIQQILKEIK